MFYVSPFSTSMVKYPLFTQYMKKVYKDGHVSYCSSTYT